MWRSIIGFHYSRSVSLFYQLIWVSERRSAVCSPDWLADHILWISIRFHIASVSDPFGNCIEQAHPFHLYNALLDGGLSLHASKKTSNSIQSTLLLLPPCSFLSSLNIMPMVVVVNDKMKTQFKFIIENYCRFFFSPPPLIVLIKLMISLSLSLFSLKFLPTAILMLGLNGTLFIFAILCIAGALFVRVFVPETKNKSIKEIQEIMSKWMWMGKLSTSFSSTVCFFFFLSVLSSKRTPSPPLRPYYR